MANITISEQVAKIIVGNTDQKGRGIFAQKSLSKGELIEIAPVIVFPPQEREFIDKTVLTNYYYEWGKYGIAMGLGFTSLYNHSFQPNALYVKKFDEMLIELWAWRDIAAGEEITTNYNGHPEDQKPIWFDSWE